MAHKPEPPDLTTVKSVATNLLQKTVIDVARLTTSNKNFVFAVKTSSGEYVVRMTNKDYRNTYEAAVYWQNKLLPLGVPLAKFIATDLDGKYSEFCTLLMHREPGDDLCNLYPTLSEITKKNLAQQIVNIHAKTTTLPLGTSYGFANTYEQAITYKTWLDFLHARIELCNTSLKKTNAFPTNIITNVLEIAADIKSLLLDVKPIPFMWDTSERNVIIHNDQISAIVDVDDMCFGDPLFVLGLTYVALEALGFDSTYCDTWAALLNLDQKAQLRLDFYRLFYTTWFMRHYADVVSDNGTPYNMNADILNKLFAESIDRINSQLPRSS
jgi:hypothetical protein